MAGHQSTNVLAEDNFFSPMNRAFYKHKTYATLDNSVREIRLLTFQQSQHNEGRLEVQIKDKIPLSSVHDHYLRYILRGWRSQRY